MEPTPIAAERGWGQRAVQYVTSAPLTLSWLMVLFTTTAIQRRLGPAQLRALLLERSTNLHHLAADPIHVLFSSLLWIDGSRWWPYLVLFVVFLIPAERWLGSWRWLIVGLLAHIIATYISEGFLYWGIQQATVSPRLINARDIGVSYFGVGIAGVLTYHIARPWRWAYLAMALALFGGTLALHPRFTALGHFIALLIGLCCYPLVRGRDRAQWNPVQAYRHLRHHHVPPA